MLSLDEALYSIIQLFASVDEDGRVWGYPTEICSVEEAKRDIVVILKNADLSQPWPELVIGKEVKS